MHRQESIFDIIINNTSIICLYSHSSFSIYPEVIIISYHGNSPSIYYPVYLTLAQVFL